MIREFDYSIDAFRGMKWRQEKAIVLRQLLQDRQDWLDTNQGQFWDDWYTDVFDLRTANDFGLVVWALILDLPNFLFVPNPSSEIFGFGLNYQNFENGNFSGATSLAIPLSSAEFRFALQIRAYQLHSDGSATQINEFFKYLFGSQGIAFVRDNYDMTITYVFNFALSPEFIFILDVYDILPTPHGVSATIEVNP